MHMMAKNRVEWPSHMIRGIGLATSQVLLKDLSACVVGVARKSNENVVALATEHPESFQLVLGDMYVYFISWLTLTMMRLWSTSEWTPRRLSERSRPP